jgi:hypothetical protein
VHDTRAFAPFYKVSDPANSQVGTLMPSITVAATAGGANASAVIPGSPAGGGSQIQIANTATTAWAYVNFGAIRDSQTVTAATTAASYPVPPGKTCVVTVDPEVNGVSVIMSLGAGNIIFTRGQGVG